jgi:hypothetical protein
MTSSSSTIAPSIRRLKATGILGKHSSTSVRSTQAKALVTKCGDRLDGIGDAEPWPESV